jgi:intracellular multiplication protein IcmD
MRKLILLLLTTGVAYACTSSVTRPETIGQVLCNIKLNSFQGIYKLIFVFSYVSGFGVFTAAIFKLKQVKDNPTQIPISTPIALFVCATLLMLLPSIITPVGETVFGSASGTAYSISSTGQMSDDAVSIIPPNLLDSGGVY